MHQAMFYTSVNQTSDTYQRSSPVSCDWLISFQTRASGRCNYNWQQRKTLSLVELWVSKFALYLKRNIDLILCDEPSTFFSFSFHQINSESPSRRCEQKLCSVVRRWLQMSQHNPVECETQRQWANIIHWCATSSHITCIRVDV